MAVCSYDALVLESSLVHCKSGYYSYLSLLQSDSFVSAVTCRETEQIEPMILRSMLNCKEHDRISSVESLIEGLKSATPQESKDLLQWATVKLIPKLAKDKDIQSLSLLLKSHDHNLQRQILHLLNTLIFFDIDIENTPHQKLNCCLVNVLDVLDEDDNFKDWNVICPIIFGLFSVAAIQHCSRRQGRENIVTEFKSTCKRIENKTEKVKQKNKKQNPKLFKVAKCILSFIKKVGKFKFGQRTENIFCRWEDAFAKQEQTGNFSDVLKQPIHEQYIICFGFLAKVPSIKETLYKPFIDFTKTLFERQTDRMWSDVMFHPLSALIVKGIINILRKDPSIATDELFWALENSYNGLTGVHEFGLMPNEIYDIIFKSSRKHLQKLAECLNLSEGEILQRAETYVSSVIPGLVVHDSTRTKQPKFSDHSYWSVCNGRIFRTEAVVSIHVPGIAHTKYDCRQSVNKLNDNEFEILLKLQKNETHSNIMRLLAFNSPKSTLPFYVVERYSTNMLDRLILAREKQEWLPLSWMNDRLIDIISALSYLHKKRIIHRNVTLVSFSLQRYQNTDHEIAVLSNLQLACYEDVGNSTMYGHVADLDGGHIPVRWSAPESILEDRYDVSTDIWMFGHVIHELFTYGCEPYTELYSESLDDVIAKVIACDLPQHKWRSIPLRYHELAKECNSFDSLKRPTAEYIHGKLKQWTGVKHVSCPETEFPKISKSQEDRRHRPERGISTFIKKLKERESGTNVRDTYFEMRHCATSPKSVLSFDDINDRTHTNIVEKRFSYLVEEDVTKKFCEEMLPKMSQDFAEKMLISQWPPKKVRKRSLDDNVQVCLKYEFKKVKNLIALAIEYDGNGPLQDRYLLHLLEVARLVERMHEKRWIMVDLTGSHLYIEEESGKACMLRIGRMVRLSPEGESNEESLVSEWIFDDMIFWMPREVIGLTCELSKGSDVYTMAMFFYEYLMAFSEKNRLQCVPFSSTHKSQLLGYLNEGQRPCKPQLCPEWLYDEVMVPSWDMDRTCRPTAEKIVKIMEERLKVNQMEADYYNSNSVIPENKNVKDTDQHITLKDQCITNTCDNGTSDIEETCVDGGYILYERSPDSESGETLNSNQPGYVNQGSSSKTLQPRACSFIGVEDSVLNSKNINLFDMNKTESQLTHNSITCDTCSDKEQTFSYPHPRISQPQPFRNKIQAFGALENKSDDSCLEAPENVGKMNPLYQSDYSKPNPNHGRKHFAFPESSKDSLDIQIDSDCFPGRTSDISCANSCTSSGVGSCNPSNQTSETGSDFSNANSDPTSDLSSGFSDVQSSNGSGFSCSNEQNSAPSTNCQGPNVGSICDSDEGSNFSFSNSNIMY